MKAEIRIPLTAAAVVLSVLLLCACPARETPAGEGKTDGHQPGASESGTPPATVESLFAGTGYDKHAPLAIDVTHDLDRVFLKQLGTESRATLIESFRLGDELSGRVEFINSDEMFRAFVRGHPRRDECLVISHRQDAPEEPIHDVLWRVTPQSRGEIEYRTTPGLGPDLPAPATYNIDAHYNWVGDRVVVVLNTGEICILDEADGTWRHVDGFPLPGAPTGQVSRPLTDESGRDLFFMSRWYIGRGGDWCVVGLLDLASAEWVSTYQIYTPDDLMRQWVIYDIAADDLLAGPWLVRGSRAPNVNTEHKRIPRLAWLDPSTGHVELPMFHGEPYWPVTLDPAGGGVVYLDQQRQGIVRLSLDAKQLEVDPRWYKDEATLYVSPDAADVYVWSGTEFFRAKFTRTEKIEE